ncbi:FtsX-like permease family protein [Roseivirga pacifica]|uniref:FtsX-like permease family protein n=1 Tax=Roseivirga pacifica TaxID=1267423 RepID=UPI00227AC2A9|nr:FtsX-like permease family protein [Roseivirga pacifica]
MHTPPKTPLKILRWFCTDERLEEIEGDLFEAYQDWRETKTQPRANWLYWWTVIRSFRLYLMKKRTHTPSMFSLMTKHFVKTALRSSIKHKSQTFINLLGLSIGIATSLILAMFIADEARMDYDLKDKELIYRVEGFNALRPKEGNNGRVHSALGPALIEVIPEVTRQTRMVKLDQDIMIDNEGGRRFFKESFLKTDSTFFDFFPQVFLKGDKNDALNNLTDIVLTESTALKLFGTTDIIGKQLHTTSRYDNLYVVTAIVKDPAPHSSIQFSTLTYLNRERDHISYPISTRAGTYVKLTPNANPKLIEAKINKAIKPIVTGDTMKATTFRLSTFEDAKYNRQALDTVLEPHNRQLYLVFTMVSIFILTLAIINYTNLTAARALQRGQEAGIRKIIGAGRKSFFFQFVTESTITCFTALFIALLIVVGMLPAFEQVLHRPLIFNYWGMPRFWAIVITSTLALSIVAGIYPAILVSRFSFAEFIKGNIANSTKGATFRKSLVTLQFIVAICMIECSIVVKNQVDFLIKKNLNYNPEQILVLDFTLSRNLGLFRDNLTKIPEVNIASITTSPTGGKEHRVSFHGNPFGEVIYQHNIDHNYAKLFNMEFIKGENFDPNTPSENEGAVIINETLAKLIMSVNPKNVEDPLSESYNFMMEPLKIKGIVKDIHFESLYETVKPMIFMYEPSNGLNVSYTLIEIKTTDVQSTISEIEELWSETIPDQIFDFQFLDTRYQNLYNSEIRLGKIMSLFTAVAILISCMGLYGLIMFMVQAKTKEISIRKVMGATVTQIIMLFNKQVFMLIGLAVLVAIPVAYFAMTNWLNAFAYHVDLSIGIIILTITCCFGLAFLTVFFRSYRAANANPVQALRNE